MSKPEIKFQEENLKTGFKNEDVSILKTDKGLSEEIVRQISAYKNEPEWMLEYRLKAYKAFTKMSLPSFGPSLTDIDFNSFVYFIRPSEKEQTTWEAVPETIKNTFAKLGIPEAEQKYLSGVSTQYESEVVYHNMLQEVQDKGVIFLSIKALEMLWEDGG